MTEPYKLTDNFKRKPIAKIIGNMGLVAVALKELRVREIIDSIIPKLGPNVKVSHGQAGRSVYPELAQLRFKA